MKKHFGVYLVVVAAIVAFSSSTQAEVSAQKWQYFEQVVNSLLYSLQSTERDRLSCSDYRSRERYEKVRKEKYKVIFDQILPLAEEGDEGCCGMIERLVLAEDPQVILRAVISETSKLPRRSQLLERLLAMGNPLVVKRFCLRPATVEDYAGWLQGFLDGGGKIDYFHDYPMRDCDLKPMWVAKKDFRIKPLYGTDSIIIIVPKGIRHLGDTGNLGHNVILEVNGFRKVGTALTINTWTDTGFR